MELPFSLSPARIGFTDITGKLVLHLGNKTLEFGFLPFGFELHPTIRKIFDRSPDLKSLGHLQGHVAKTNALNMTAEINFGMRDSFLHAATVATNPEQVPVDYIHGHGEVAARSAGISPKRFHFQHCIPELPEQHIQENSGSIILMGNYDYEGHPEGDWDERGNVSWNEFDWQQFLKRQQKEVARFVSLYDRYLDEPDHLDRVAQEMGWDREDWSVGDGLEDDEDEAETPEQAEDFDPYTLHRHPVFVVTAGLYAQIRYLWDCFLGKPSTLTPRQASRLSNTLAAGEQNLILTIQAVDMGDFLLGVCHGKLALRAINETMAQLEPLAAMPDDAPRFLNALRMRLFDLRDVALRVMNDCREEERRGFRDSD